MMAMTQQMHPQNPHTSSVPAKPSPTPTSSLTEHPSSTPSIKPQPPIDLELARQYFEDVKQICRKDNGHLWGRPIGAPLMLVEPKSRFIVTSEADAGGVLKADHGVFVGQLPEDKNIFNTIIEWSGKKWAQILWPVPRDLTTRREVMVHEQFHLLQPMLGIRARSGGNPQVDSLDGRYLLQLEWRALKTALLTKDQAPQTVAIEDALLFRARRYQLFPSAEESESSLELVEGTATYTGIKLGAESDEQRIRYAVNELNWDARKKAYARIFPYASGLAYGLLLDQYASNWRKLAMDGYGFAEIMTSRLEWKAPGGLQAEVEKRAAVYDGKKLWADEEARESVYENRFGRLRSLLVDGPTLKLPRVHADVQINPDEEREYEGVGTICLTLRVVADWGILEVSKAALLDGQGRVVVPAPFTVVGQGLSGDGWTLRLNSGWQAVPAGRPGDFVLKKVN